MSDPLRIVVLGLSISSSWGNGHATTYRALVRGLARLGHRVLFLERDVPWYAENRDAPRPDGCEVGYYASLTELERAYRSEVRHADAVLVGSYVPDGTLVARWVVSTAQGLRVFYDIDTPVTIARLRAGNEEYIGRDTIPRFDAYLSFTGGPTLRTIEREFGAALALPFYCSADPSRYAPSGDRPTIDLGYLGTYSADRQGGLEELLFEPAQRWPAGRFVVAGACYPETVVWPENVTHSVHVAPAEHAKFYGAQRFTLNVTREDMRRAGYAPSVRLFEAAACATPVISDVWEGIEAFFEPRREILLAGSNEEVLDYLRRLGEDERREIGRRAQKRVLGEHTGEHRAKQLERYLRDLPRSSARAARGGARRHPSARAG